MIHGYKHTQIAILLCCIAILNGCISGGSGSGSSTTSDGNNSSTSTATVSMVCEGYTNTFAIRSDGTLWGWGLYTTTENTRPEKISPDTNWGKFEVNYDSGSYFAIKTDGALWAWGKNDEGQLGDGTTNWPSNPERIGTDNDWISVDSADSNTFAIKSNGTLWAWGRNGYGEHGDGTTTPHHIPTRVGIDSDWTAVSASWTHTVALKTNGTLWSWGSQNSCGELGNGANSSVKVPMQIGLDSNWASVCTGDYCTLAIKSNGTLWAWGSNSGNQLGLGVTAPSNVFTPTQVGTDNHWRSVSVGKYFALALKTDGSLWAWGRNGDGECGTGSTSSSVATPTRIGDANNWTNISAGYSDGAAIMSDGSLWVWGANTNVYG